MEQRRLAAIMFTDMVGYSALVQKNEVQALRLLEEHQVILRSVFPSFHGKEIKTIGDAFLVEFPSALDATRCAIAIQKSLSDRNGTFENERQIWIRIGLHVGDVVFKENDVFGDGINIAARIEPMATPGGICCSGEVATQIQNKIDYPLIRLGKADLKNIETAVILHEIRLPWQRRRKFASLKSLTRPAFRNSAIAAGMISLAVVAYSLWQSVNMPSAYSRERIAVLPFENISADAGDEYFADGITEELISTLSKIGSISVIARTSVAKYKNLSKSAQEIGRELMVGTILEGSVRKVADKARITVKLIDVVSQKPIWSNDYDEEIKDMFVVQSDIAQKVAGELRIQLVAAERAQLEKRGTESTEATRLYFLGRFFLNQRTAESIQKGVEFFNQAIQADPSFAPPYAGLAECYTLMGAAGYGFLPHQVAVERAKANAQKALELDKDLAEAHTVLAYVQFRLEWDWKNAEGGFRRAIALKPSYAKAHEWYALYLALQGRNTEALPEMKRALELDPLSSSVGTGLGRLLTFGRQYESALEQFHKTLSLDSTYAEAHFGLGLTYANMEQYDKAIAEIEKAARLSGERHVILAVLGYVYAKADRMQDARRIYNRMMELSKTIHVSPYCLAFLSLGLGERDRAIEYLLKAYEERDGLVIYLKAEDIGREFRTDPRFQDILRKIGLEP